MVKLLVFKYFQSLRRQKIVQRTRKFDVNCCMFVRASLHKRREENQLDATKCFIAVIICSTCSGHLYAHHQEFETIFVLLSHMLCNVLVAGGRLLGAEQQAMRPG